MTHKQVKTASVIMQTKSVALALFVLGLLCIQNRAFADEARKNEFFENKIRPLLAKHCFACHGEKKQQAELRLDHPEFVFKGNDSGPAVIKGNPKKSRLIEVIQYDENDSQMPPKGKMPQHEIDLLTQWVSIGAPWPNAKSIAPLKNGEVDYEKIRNEHWSYRPVAKPTPPDVKAPTPIDKFIVRKLNEKNISLSPEADKRTIIRRVTYDLTGLPPTYEDVENFIADDSPEAYTNLIERLLASTQYGEHWGRHWLDVARYADTKGYVFQEDIYYPFAYSYRNYVIRAFNEDLPYDEFIKEQLAADMMDRQGDDRKLAALGFLTVGDRFLNKRHEIINDRIDVVSRGLLGMTAACARCHDHKFDPIPTDDYYSLYGVFASAEEPDELPLLDEPEETPEYLEYKKELDRLRKVHSDMFDQFTRELQEESRAKVALYMYNVAVTQKSYLKANKPDSISGIPNRTILGRWNNYFKVKLRENDPIFKPWGLFGKLKPEEFSTKAASVVQNELSKDKNVHPILAQKFRERIPQSMIDVVLTYSQLFEEINDEWLAAKKKNNKIESLTDPARESLRLVLYGDGTPSSPLRSELRPRSFNGGRNSKLLKAEKLTLSHIRRSRHSPARAMVMYDKPNLYNPRVFIRGTLGRLGKVVPRRFFQVLSTKKEHEKFRNGSGRLDLANAIVDKNNPLTARVMVNRVWMHHFGEGIVTTPSDFGIQGSRPSHPELLDYLASCFMESGWSIKDLHRHIMHTAVYRQASFDRDEAYAVDPENILLWKMPTRRLQFEAMRDSMLQAAGTLNTRSYNKPFDLRDEPEGLRTLYARVNRNDLPNLLQVFDFASPDASVAQRSQTTVPQQALFQLNSPFVIGIAKRIIQHPEVGSEKDPRKRIVAMYQRILSRDPSKNEIEAAIQYIEKESLIFEASKKDPKILTPWEQLAQILCLTNEFMFVD